ncbi:hypothetical protein [Bdellovibrio sp. BCCA]
MKLKCYDKDSFAECNGNSDFVFVFAQRPLFKVQRHFQEPQEQ